MTQLKHIEPLGTEGFNEKSLALSAFQLFPNKGVPICLPRGINHT